MSTASSPSKKRKLDTEESESNPKSPKSRKLSESSESEPVAAAAESAKKPAKPANELKLDASQSVQIIFLTGNKGKLREVQSYLGDELKESMLNYKVDLEEIQGTEKEIMCSKLREAKKEIAAQLKGKDTDDQSVYILVEDTSLFLGQYSDSEKFNFPGPFCKFLLKAKGCQGYLDMVKGHEDRSCTAQCMFGMVKVEEGAEPMYFVGQCQGKIPEKERGADGFGWDPIFEFAGNGKTFAEMSVEEKNKISHRANACEKLKAYLVENVMPKAKEEESK